MRGYLLPVALTLALLAPEQLRASDHADPAFLPNGQPEANLTDLFFFPLGDRYVAIMDARGTLTAAPPYKLKPYTYTINIDTHSRVAPCPTLMNATPVGSPPFGRPGQAPPAPTAAAPASPAPGGATNPYGGAAPAGPAPAPPYGAAPTPVAAPTAAAPPATTPPAAGQRPPRLAAEQMRDGDCARYGGTILDPTGIKADISITYALDDYARLSREKLKVVGLRSGTPIEIFNDDNLAQLKQNPARYANAVWVYTGIRDDPFIFPPFFNANTITIVVSIPKDAIVARSPDWLLWGTSNFAKNGKQIDHDGRSNRTQLGRFDLLNPHHPSQQVRVLRDATRGRVKMQDFLRQVLRPFSQLNQLSGFLLRSYDYAPDVVMFRTQYPVGFPNGRWLTDDVAKITCDNGDCPLLENSYVTSPAYPRATRNDREFMTEFPYLAERWPYRPQPFTGSPWIWFMMNLLWPLVLLIVIVGAIAWWIHRTRVRLRAKKTAHDVAVAEKAGETP